MATLSMFDKAIERLKRDPSRPVRVRADSLEVELRVVSRPSTGLGTRIAALGPWEGESEADLLERLRQARGTAAKHRPSLKEHLLSMADVGPDDLFERSRDRPRRVKL